MSAKNKQEYAYLAYLTEPRQVGESTKRSPQHLTLVPPFLFNLPLVKLQEAVHEVAADTKAFKVSIGEQDRFGPTRNITVRLIQPADLVRALHYRLMYNLQARGVQLPNKFVYDEYLPHITFKPSHSTELVKGQTLTIDHVALMHKGTGRRTLLAREPLSGE